MNTNANTHNNDNAPRPTREDILVGRITDGEATPNDWAEIESIAGTDASVWHRLAEAQRTHARTEAAVEDAIAIAELIDIPDLRRTQRPVIGVIREYAGWAIAASLAVALTITVVNNARQPAGPNTQSLAQGPDTSTPSVIPANDMTRNDTGATNSLVAYNPAQGYDQYLHHGYEQGFVLGAEPPVIQEARRLPDGTYDVIFSRTHFERRNVTDLSTYRVQIDEWGTERLTPAENDPNTINIQQIY